MMSPDFLDCFRMTDLICQVSAVTTSYDSGLRLGYRLAHRGNQGAEHRRIVAWGFNNDDGKLQFEAKIVPGNQVKLPEPRKK